jgi:MoaA/NifB/PqqE/SkfB family radical SAM enzyme
LEQKSKTRGLWTPDRDTDWRDPATFAYPKKLMFTLTGTCNLRCRHCPRALGRPAGRTTPQPLVEYVTHRLVPRLRSIRLGGNDLGEQLLAPSAPDFMRELLARPELDSELITNLTFVDDELLDLVVNSFRTVYVSLEGLGPTYENYRGFSWETFRVNLKRLHDHLLRSLRPCTLALSITCTSETLEDLPSILELAEFGVRKFCYRPFFANIPEQNDWKLESRRELAEEVFSRLKAEGTRLGLDVSVPNLPPAIKRTAALGIVAAPTKRAPVSGRWICHFPFETISIMSDGSVSACCYDLTLGHLDLEKPDLIELWESETYRRLRESFLGDLLPVCTNCEILTQAYSGMRSGKKPYGGWIHEP